MASGLFKGYIYIKCSVESRDTVLNTWEVDLYKVYIYI